MTPDNQSGKAKVVPSTRGATVEASALQPHMSHGRWLNDTDFEAQYNHHSQERVSAVSQTSFVFGPLRCINILQRFVSSSRRA